LVSGRRRKNACRQGVAASKPRREGAPVRLNPLQSSRESKPSPRFGWQKPYVLASHVQLTLSQIGANEAREKAAKAAQTSASPATFRDHALREAGSVAAE